jgi:hypothetical protein
MIKTSIRGNFMINLNNYCYKLKKERGFDKIIHIHADHFEPFMSSERMSSDEEFSNFFMEMKKNPWSSNMSLNYIFPLGRTIVGQEKSGCEHFGAPGDDFLFSLTKKDDFLYRFFENINKNNMDMQFHIHHERFTNNDFYKSRKVEVGNEHVYDFIKNKSTKKMDSARFEFTIKLYKELFKRYGGIEKTKWTFVHGCWALNGSDPEICKISDELVILKNNGCVADLSLPAGRSHCDSTIYDIPTIINPCDEIMCYNNPKNILKSWDGKSVNQGVLVWASGNKGSIYSMDFYGKSTSSLIDPKKRVVRWLKNSPVINNTLYIKTHAHSAHRYYINKEHPLSSSYAKSAFEGLIDACKFSKVDIGFASCGEILT